MPKPSTASSTPRSAPAATGLPQVGVAERLGRVALLLAGMAGLVTGLLGGLGRVPLAAAAPVTAQDWMGLHGPLMVCGFLGTLIGIERAVGLRLWWPWAAPALSGLALALLLGGAAGAWPVALFVLASACFVLVCWKIDSLQPALSNIVMALGAVSWLAGNTLWLLGRPMPVLVPWWMAFLILTILGERIQLTRYRKTSPWARPWLLVALGLLTAGLLCGTVRHPDAMRTGGVMFGAGLAAMSAWLITFDIARITIRHEGLPRFMAACLLLGYVWLGVAALLFVAAWPCTGFLYDACLHAVFVGFVFLMIFGHAPVIFPAVLGLPVKFSPVSYLPVVLLNAALLLRIGADVLEWPAGRVWGSTGNALAVALFLVLTLRSVLGGAAQARGRGKSPK